MIASPCLISDLTTTVGTQVFKTCCWNHSQSSQDETKYVQQKQKA